MKPIDYYKKGWGNAIDLLEMMALDDSYESWQDMIDDLRDKKLEVVKNEQKGSSSV